MAHDSATHMHAEAQKADPWVRPFAMEAAIRSGADRGHTFTVFDATPDEQAKVDELLAKPSIWSTI